MRDAGNSVSKGEPEKPRPTEPWRNDSACCRPCLRHNLFLQRSPSLSATACSRFVICVRACTIRCRCHSSCRRSRISQLGTQIFGKRSSDYKSTDLCMAYDGYQGIGLQAATRRTLFSISRFAYGLLASNFARAASQCAISPAILSGCAASNCASGAFSFSSNQVSRLF
jgi:hypothetical protein